MMDNLDKILSQTPKADAPTETAKKAVKKSAAPKPTSAPAAPGIARAISSNPIPNSPEIGGLVPGDASYPYAQAVSELAEEINALTTKLKGLRDASREVQVMKNQLTRPLTSVESNDALRRTHQRIAAAEQEKQAKIAAVLKEMGLS